MAFCPNCGTNNNEGALNCAQCGTALNGNTPSPLKKNNNTTLFAVIAAIFVAIVAIIIFNSSSPSTPIKNYVKAMNTGEVKYLKKVYPKALYNSMDSEELEAVEKSLETSKEITEKLYGEGKYKVKILSKTKIDKDDLEDVQERLEKLYDNEDIAKTPKVTAGYKVKVKMTYDGSKKEDTDTSTIYVYKVNGQWCMI